MILYFTLLSLVLLFYNNYLYSLCNVMCFDVYCTNILFYDNNDLFTTQYSPCMVISFNFDSTHKLIRLTK